MEGFRFVREQEVEFRELDGLGHVNNAVYLSYFESAKVAYFRDVVGVTEIEELGIVAEAKVAFRSPAFFGETLAVGVRVSRIGTKSLEFEFQVEGPDGRLVAEGSSVHVTFDYARREPIPVPASWREKIETYEARSPAAA